MKTKTNGSLASCVLIGTALCIITTTVGVSVFAWLISNAYVSEKSAAYICTGVLIISALTGTTAAVWKAKEVLWISLITALLYFAVLLSCTAIFFDGIYEGVGVTALCVAGSALCTVLLNAHRGRGKRHVVKKRK